MPASQLVEAKELFQPWNAGHQRDLHQRGVGPEQGGQLAGGGEASPHVARCREAAMAQPHTHDENSVADNDGDHVSGADTPAPWDRQSRRARCDASPRRAHSRTGALSVSPAGTAMPPVPAILPPSCRSARKACGGWLRPMAATRRPGGSPRLSPTTVRSEADDLLTVGRSGSTALALVMAIWARSGSLSATGVPGCRQIGDHGWRMAYVRRRRRRVLGVAALLGLFVLAAASIRVGSPHSKPATIASLTPPTDKPFGDVPALPTTLPSATPTPASALAVAHLGRILRIPIFMYHYIRVDSNPTDRLGFNLSVTPANFAAQMDYLQRRGMHTITPAQLMAALDAGAALPPQPVILSFDDGHDDFATVAEPILKAHGFVAVDYVITGFLGRPSFMTAAQIVAMDRAGMVIGCHTVDHLALEHLNAAHQRFEIVAAQHMLETLLGHPVVDFAYPFGSYNGTTISILAEAGFRDAGTTIAGEIQVQGSPFTLERIREGPPGLGNLVRF